MRAIPGKDLVEEKTIRRTIRELMFFKTIRICSIFVFLLLCFLHLAVFLYYNGNLSVFWRGLNTPEISSTALSLEYSVDRVRLHLSSWILFRCFLFSVILFSVLGIGRYFAEDVLYVRCVRYKMLSFLMPNEKEKEKSYEQLKKVGVDIDSGIEVLPRNETTLSCVKSAGVDHSKSIENRIKRIENNRIYILVVFVFLLVSGLVTFAALKTIWNITTGYDSDILTTYYMVFIRQVTQESVLGVDVIGIKGLCETIGYFTITAVSLIVFIYSIRCRRLFANYNNRSKVHLLEK